LAFWLAAFVVGTKIFWECLDQHDVAAAAAAIFQLPSTVAAIEHSFKVFCIVAMRIMSL
jgi:hypothetical protein